MRKNQSISCQVCCGSQPSSKFFDEGLAVWLPAFQQRAQDFFWALCDMCLYRAQQVTSSAGPVLRPRLSSSSCSLLLSASTTAPNKVGTGHASLLASLASAMALERELQSHGLGFGALVLGFRASGTNLHVSLRHGSRNDLDFGPAFFQTRSRPRRNAWRGQGRPEAPQDCGKAAAGRGLQDCGHQ